MDFDITDGTRVDDFSGWSDEDDIYEAENKDLDPESHTHRFLLRDALPGYRDGAIRSSREGNSSGPSIYREEYSKCSVSIDRLVWVDGWRQEGVGEAMTLVVLKLGFKPLHYNARVSYASLGLRLKSDKREDEDPKLVAWGPFRRPERWNVTVAHKRSDVSPSLNFSGGGGGAQVSLGVNFEKEMSWDENYTDYGLSAETPNGVRWQVFENGLLKRGITPEVRVAALFSRPPSEKYRVEVNIMVLVRTGFATQAKDAIARAFGRSGNRVYWSVEARPGLKDNYHAEGADIIKGIDPDNLGGILDPRDSTNLNAVWLNSWDRFETNPQALTESTKTEGKPAVDSASSRQEAEQPMPKKEEPSQDAGRQVSQEHPYESITGVSRLTSGGATDSLPRPPRAPGAGGLDEPTALLPDVQHVSRLVALEDRAARAEARIAEQDRRILELQQTLTRVAQALLLPTLTDTRVG